jgi:hypothetical protein
MVGEGPVPRVEPLCPLAGVVIWHLEIKVLDVLAHLTAEAASLVV